MSSNGSPTSSDARPYIGGQAVIEGVMMRSPRSFSIVVRRRWGALSVRERAMPNARTGPWSWPLLRGVATLVEAIRLGSQSLRYSAERFEADLEAEEQGTLPPAGSTRPGSGGPGVLGMLTAWIVGLATADIDSSQAPEPSGRRGSFTWVALVAAMLLFVALPQAATEGVNKLLHLGLDVRTPLFQVITGAFKLSIVLGYMLAIRRIPEIRRVFQYHGAEHKAIATYEAGEDLTVANARAKSRLHPRCGTTFLVMVVFVSILVFSAIGPLLPRMEVGKVAENVIFFLMKLPFLPVIAAITYEIQRLTARYCLTGPLRATLYPGFAVQGITTIEPDDSQLEIALASLRATLWREQAPAGQEPPEVDTTFGSFDELMHARQRTQDRPFAPVRESDATA
jgi:uncharacterized protein YqhQ